MKKLILMIALAGVVGCGGNDQEAVEGTEPETPAKSEPVTSNPLATQQQAIKDAQAVQDILDTDAEEKKKKLDEIN
jgi:hypothetical protein